MESFKYAELGNDRKALEDITKLEKELSEIMGKRIILIAVTD